MPGADPADFFNYGLNINTWKEYVARIHQFRLEFTMQKKIQTYESSNDTPALDPDPPPELAAAVAQGRQQVPTHYKLSLNEKILFIIGCCLFLHKQV